MGQEVNGVGDGSAQLFLTFAELECVLSTDAWWPSVRLALGLPEPMHVEETVAAGFASLTVRSLARRTDDEVELADVLAGARGLIAAASSWFRVAQVTNESVVFAGTIGMGVRLPGHVVVSPVGSGCFEIVAASAHGTPQASLASLVCGALQRSGDGRVAIASVPGGDEPDISVTLESSFWTVVADGETRAGLTYALASAAVEARLATLLSRRAVR